MNKRTQSTCSSQRTGQRGILYVPKKVLAVCVLDLAMMVTQCTVGGAPRGCPPGGRWFDKHVGPNGRWACCSEICEPKGFFTETCKKKCPDYETLKARATSTMTADPSSKAEWPDSQINSAQQQQHPTNIVLYTLIPVIVCVGSGAAVFLFVKARFQPRKPLPPQRGQQGAGAGGGEASEEMVPDANAAVDAPVGGQARVGTEEGRPEEERDHLLDQGELRQGDPNQQQPGGGLLEASVTCNSCLCVQTAKEEGSRVPVPVEDNTQSGEVHVVH